MSAIRLPFVSFFSLSPKCASCDYSLVVLSIYVPSGRSLIPWPALRKVFNILKLLLVIPHASEIRARTLAS